MTVFPIKVLTVPAMALALAGCAASGNTAPQQDPHVRQVTQSAHCGLTGPGVAYVDSQEGLESFLEVRGQNMSTGVIRQVDLSQEQLIFVTLGQKPTAGYSLGLAGVSQEKSTLKLHMDLKAPEPGTMVAQVITSPCVVLAAASGDWDRLEVTGVTDQPMVERVKR
ncbi:MAG: protease complex subunit PrcB family protein [Marinobacter sp.]|uniref:protease complex subunit PrcB family protein n=1 Tax=unclassified Marinobacter TaxID=83889 RepID=UPI00273BEC5F|nr:MULTISPECIES: protease complex subunit PrcB family protein [unclassified Marinobacter]MDP4547014.1 protease complex subunit PrcB family protein [Marinobacter sp. MDS2]